MKNKIILIIFIIISFFFSYYFKNFPAFILSLFLVSLFLFTIRFVSKNLSLIIASILFGLFIVEFILFIPSASSNLSNEINKNKKKDVHIKNIITDLGYQPVSGIQNHKIFNKNEVLFDKYYTILGNNYRLTPRINDDKKLKKINFFGGSKTFGWGLNDDETLPYLMQSFFPKIEINN